jgi:DNA invertase Pin-like site-specific DNA recombinase
MSKQVLAIALCRVSSIEQLENNSLSRQRSAVLKAAQDLGVTIPDDCWWSGSVSSKRGTNIDRRDLQEMLDRCKKDKRIKYAIVDEVDRFMRSMLEIGYFLVEFTKLGVKVVFASQPNLKTDTAIDTLLLMLEAFKAEGSNEERQRKSIKGQTEALRKGLYTFSPKPGYMKGSQKGVQEIDGERGRILQTILVSIATHQVTPTQALINLNKSNFVKGRALYKMDKFRKIATDPFYAGIVEIQKQVSVRNENGLHEPLLTMAQHLELVRIFNSKKKTQAGPRKNGNPKYPLSNHVSCDLCKDTSNIGRYVGYDHGNGKNPDLVYEKYRCRGCGRYLTRDELHSKIVKHFDKYSLDDESLNDLLEALNTVWKQKEGETAKEVNRVEGRIKNLQQTVINQVEAASDPSNISIKEDILGLIAKRKEEISELEEHLERLKAHAESDHERFLTFAFDFIENMGSRFLEISPENRLRCKQIVFPGGIYLNKNNKVYTPEISLLYRLATKKKDAEASSNSLLVRVTGL